MFYFKDDKQITIYFSNGDITAWSVDSPLYDKILTLCKNSDWVKVEAINYTTKHVMNSNINLDNDGNIIVNNVTLDKEIVESDKLLSLIKLLQDKGSITTDIEAVKPFLKNCIENTYIDAVHEIYEYCKAMDFEITEDGCFLAYKNVNPDLGSIYDGGKTKHVIGQVTKVKVFDTDRNRTCSKGLHFCSKEYLKSYSGSVTIIVKVNPKDVCAIPVDYNFAKGRCVQYTTVGIMPKDKSFEDIDVVKVTEQKIVKPTVEKTKNRIQETVYWFIHFSPLYKDLKDVYSNIANKMNISIETVRRNIRKFNQKKRESSLYISKKIQF